MTTHLDVRDAPLVVERALVEAIELGYRVRLKTVADVAALKALTSVGTGDVLIPNVLYFVTAEGVCYRWKKFSTNAENLPAVVRPSDRASATYGRWERQFSTVTLGPAYFRPVHRVATGYAKAVQLWTGDEGTEAGEERIFAQSPAFLVRFVGDDLKMAANHPRGLNDVKFVFEVRCYARNLRDERQAFEGSAITSENDDQPGLVRMMGDIRYLLAGSDLGIAPGVRYVDIQGGGSVVSEDLAERKFEGVVPITVFGTYNIPDEDLIPVESAYVKFKDASLGQDGLADTSNYVAKGLRLNHGPSSGLNQALTPGTAYVGGQLVSVQPGVHQYTASKDTYVDLGRDGVLSFSEVAVNAEAPAKITNTLRIMMVRSDATDLTGWAPIADYVQDSIVEEFQAAP